MPTSPRGFMEAARRRYETANMEACEVPRVSHNGDLRASFRADQSPDDEPKVYSHMTHRHVAGTQRLSAATIPSASVDQYPSRQGLGRIEPRYNTELCFPASSQFTRDTERGSISRPRRITTNPTLSNEDERDRTYAEGFAVSSDAQIRPLVLSAASTNIAVEPESPPNSQEQPATQYRYLHRRNRDSGSSYVPSIHMTRNGVYQHKHRRRSFQSDSDTDFDKRRAPKRLDCKYVALGQRNKERFDLSDCDTDVETTPALKRRKRKNVSPGHNDDPLFPLSDSDTDSDTTPALVNTTQVSNKQESEYVALEQSNKPRCTQCGSTIDIEITHVLVNATQVPISTTEAPEEEESSIDDRPPMKQRCIDLAKSSLCMQGWNARKGAFGDVVSGLPGLRHARSWCAERAQMRIERGVVRVVKQ